MSSHETSRRSFATRSTFSTDFSAVIRHAKRQHLSNRYANRNLPREKRSGGGVSMTTLSSAENYAGLARRLAARPIVSRFPLKGAGRVVEARVEPRFRAMTVFVIFARILLVLWLATRLGALILDGACGALWAAAVAYLAERRELAQAGRPQNGNAYVEVEEQGGVTAL